MTDATTTATTTTGDTTTTATTTAPAWHSALGAEVVGKAQQKGWDISDPSKAFAAAAQAFMGAEKLIGHPPEKIARIPELSAQPAELDAFWQRLGMPKEAKEYDLSSVKRGGQPIEEAFAEALRGAFHTNRIPKDAAAPIAQAVSKFLDDIDATASAGRTARTQEQTEALKTSWGHNYDVNLTVSKQAFTRIAVEAGLDEAKAKEAVDAISALGGVGAANVLKMFQVIGSKMGEGKFITIPRPGGGDMPMTREAAVAEIQSLQQDTGFRQKLLNGDVASNQRWTQLHQIATGSNSRAA